MSAAELLPLMSLDPVRTSTSPKTRTPSRLMRTMTPIMSVIQIAGSSEGRRREGKGISGRSPGSHAGRRERTVLLLLVPVPKTGRKKEAQSADAQKTPSPSRRRNALDGDDTGDNVVGRDDQVLEQVVPSEGEADSGVEVASRVTWETGARITDQHLCPRSHQDTPERAADAPAKPFL
jgi:hypothetical protein